MTDLINNSGNTTTIVTTIQPSLITIEKLRENYGKLVDEFNKIPIDDQLYIINACVNHINSKYKELNSTIKAWCVYVVYKQWQNRIQSESLIPKYIDEFVTYFNDNSEAYLLDIDYAYSEYDKYIPLINKYLKS
jgi:hypothetical protein